MIRFSVIGTAMLICMSILSSCEKGYDYIEEEISPKRFAVVNNVEYQLTNASFTKKSGDINLEAQTVEKDLTIFLTMKNAQWGTEYDLNNESDFGSKSLQITFSDVSKECYTIGIVGGPNQMNVDKGYSTEIRTVETAKAKICKNPDGTYSVFASAKGKGLSFEMDLDNVTRK